MLFLDVLATNNNLGSELFSKLFHKVDVKTIFRFLDDSTNFLEDFNDIDRWLLVSENRPTMMKWAVCSPK